MSVALSRDGACSRIQLDGTINIESAAKLKATLLEALGAGQEICISLEKATDLDVTAVQLLWAAERDAKQRGIGFSVTGMPEGICRRLEEAGLEFPAATPGAVRD